MMFPFFTFHFGGDMLVLSRKTGQQIHIGPDITISILEIGGKLVRIGIDAPDSFCILRGEVKEQIEQENRLAADQAKNIESLKKISPFFHLPFRSVQKKNNSDNNR
jgi:carbon storage regulator